MKLSYRAYDASGRLVTGDMDGLTETDILSKLRHDGLFPFETSAGGSAKESQSWLTRDIGGTGLNLADRARFARILAALLKAGVPLDRALRIMTEQGHSKRIAKLSSEAAEAVAAGKTLSSVLANPATGFARHEVGLVVSAEQTGSFAPVLEDMAAMLDKRLELRSRLSSALVYPIVLLVMGLASMVVIATVLVPNLAPLFADNQSQMPWIMGAMISVIDLIKNHGLTILIAVPLFAAALFLALRSEGGKATLGRWLLKLRTVRQFEAARICRTMATLLKNGVPLQNAIRATAEAVKNNKVATELHDTLEKVVGGARLSRALETVSVLDPSARQLISIGEEANRVDDIMLHLANTLESDSSRRLERLMTLLTPLMTVALGMLIGGLIMSVMRAILSVNDLAIS